jgi:hypothetical protein
MNQSRDYDIVCLSEAIAPITQMSGVSGNYALVMREPVVTSRGVTQVPNLSGNAIRHRAIREPGFRWLVGEFDLVGKLTLPQLNFLFHGGNLTEGGGRENTRRIADWQRLFPLGRLLGGCLPDQVLAGSLQVHRGMLVCEENRPSLAHILGNHLPERRLRPAESFVSGYQYTRGDAVKSAMDLRPVEPPGESNSNLMIFSGQSVLSGAIFIHGFTMPHVSELELGALLWSLYLWQSTGGTIGGQASRGHGRLKLGILESDWDGEAAINAYLDYARSTKDEAAAWLNDVFAPRVPRASRGGPEMAETPEEGDGPAASAPRSKRRRATQETPEP